jgi:nicotinic acid phosphoribosyltransferase
MRAANSNEDHMDSVRTLASVGLRMTSSGVAGARVGIATGGSMGHRYTQRFASDYQAYTEAIDRILEYKNTNVISGKVKLSLLLDTRNTLRSGLPAAVRVIQERLEEIKQHIELSVRLDSGDLEKQLTVIIQEFQQALPYPTGWPAIILESGLTAQAVARFEHIAKTLGYPRDKLLYGVGGYLVGGIARDFISLVYKVSSYNGIPTMKFADERQRGKESYPGNVTLLEETTDGQLQRMVALREETETLRRRGWQEVFVDLVRDGRYVGPRIGKSNRIAYIQRRWQQVGRGYLGEEKFPEDFPRKPRHSEGVDRLVERLRSQQLNFALPNLVAIHN